MFIVVDAPRLSSKCRTCGSMIGAVMASGMAVAGHKVGVSCVCTVPTQQWFIWWHCFRLSLTPTQLAFVECDITVDDILDEVDTLSGKATPCCRAQHTAWCQPIQASNQPQTTTIAYGCCTACVLLVPVAITLYLAWMHWS